VDLVEAFKYIVSELRKGDLQPFIHSYNSTTVGQMVKDSYRGQLRTPALSGLSPLLYLAEMGVQKLSRDYMHIFFSKRLANTSMLEHYLKGNLELEDKLTRLTKLHDALETVVMLKKYLSLPHESLANCCWKMLKHYESNNIERHHSFNFTIPTASVRGVFEKFAPTEWSVESSRLVDGVRERQVFLFTQEAVCDWLHLEGPAPGKGGEEVEDEVPYHLTVLTDSVSIFWLVLGTDLTL